MKRILTCCRFALLLIGSYTGTCVFAQDVHFSQFYTQPLTINPANTGYFNGNYRVGGIYRAQWPFSANGKFVTYNNYSIYNDYSMLGAYLGKSDFMGVGLFAWNDDAGDGNLRTTKIGATVAYHKGFDKKGKYLLSGGFGFTAVQRAVDFKNFYFNNQWNDRFFDRSIPNLEQFSNQNYWYFDLSAGLNMHIGIGTNNVLSIGAALYHINRPKDSFRGQNSRIGMRPIFNVNFNGQLSRQFEINTQFIFNYQKEAIETSIGVLLGYSSANYRNKIKTTYYAGLYYRIRDAVIPTIGYQINTTRLLLSYDFTVSKFTYFNKGVGGFELSLVHTGIFKSQNVIKKIYCPKF